MTTATRRPSRRPAPLVLTPTGASDIAGLFKLASDPTRLTILAALTEGPKHVGDLCTLLNSNQPAVSHHLALMRVAGILDANRKGKHIFYSLLPPARQIVKTCHALLAM